MSSVNPIGAAAPADDTAMIEYLVLSQVFEQALQGPPVDDEDGDSSAPSQQVTNTIAMDMARAVTGFGA